MPSSTPSPAKRRKLAHPKGLFRTGRSVWNSTDDWDELVATSSLSTSSVSTRPPRPRALPSLAKSAEDVAVRHFRMLWADGKSSEPAELDPEDERGGKRKKTGKGTARERKERNERQEENQKGWWELQWPHVPDHLKARVTDGIMRMHGGWLSLDVIRKVRSRTDSILLAAPDLRQCCPRGKLLTRSSYSSFPQNTTYQDTSCPRCRPPRPSPPLGSAPSPCTRIPHTPSKCIPSKYSIAGSTRMPQWPT